MHRQSPALRPTAVLLPEAYVPILASPRDLRKESSISQKNREFTTHGKLGQAEAQRRTKARPQMNADEWTSGPG